ncbi:MAG: hypothetical protein EOO38_31575 [Cytophagaceae bacterium]|nr:MAG: hypothetical protein EOO38_31575 [Cytophagaceae bacterium]
MSPTEKLRSHGVRLTFADIVDRELAVVRCQEQLDLRDALLHGRKAHMAPLEGEEEKLARIHQNLTAREANLNRREAIWEHRSYAC